MKIRKAKLEDAKIISVLRKATFELVNSKEYNSLQVKDLIDNSNLDKMIEKIRSREMFCLVDGRKILGTVDLDGDKIAGVVIRKNYLRRGIGTKLMNFIEDYAKKKGLKKVKLFSTPLAVLFYQGLGYKKIKEVSSSTTKGVYLPTYKMEKILK